MSLTDPTRLEKINLLLTEAEPSISDGHSQRLPERCQPA
jgi:hypothetical protein